LTSRRAFAHATCPLRSGLSPDRVETRWRSESSQRGVGRRSLFSGANRQESPQLIVAVSCAQSCRGGSSPRSSPGMWRGGWAWQCRRWRLTGLRPVSRSPVRNRVGPGVPGRSMIGPVDLEAIKRVAVRASVRRHRRAQGGPPMRRSIRPKRATSGFQSPNSFSHARGRDKGLAYGRQTWHVRPGPAHMRLLAPGRSVRRTARLLHFSAGLIGRQRLISAPTTPARTEMMSTTTALIDS
jgi:hypothetical protein